MFFGQTGKLVHWPGVEIPHTRGMHRLPLGVSPEVWPSSELGVTLSVLLLEERMLLGGIVWGLGVPTQDHVRTRRAIAEFW